MSEQLGLQRYGFIIQLTSYDDTTVSRTVVFATLMFVIVKPLPTIDTKIILPNVFWIIIVLNKNRYTYIPYY